MSLAAIFLAEKYEFSIIDKQSIDNFAIFLKFLFLCVFRIVNIHLGKYRFSFEKKNNKSCFEKLNYMMASPILPKRSRPRIDVGTQISLRMDVFNKWLIKKDLAGIADKTHNEFVSYLLETVGQNQLNSIASQLISSEYKLRLNI